MSTEQSPPRHEGPRSAERIADDDKWPEVPHAGWSAIMRASAMVPFCRCGRPMWHHCDPAQVGDCREYLPTASDELKSLSLRLAESERALLASEEYRHRYRDGKLQLYAMGGEIQEAAMEHLPASEGPLESWVRWHILLPQHRMVVDDLHATALALEAAEAKLAESEREREQARKRQRDAEEVADSVIAKLAEVSRSPGQPVLRALVAAAFDAGWTGALRIEQDCDGNAPDYDAALEAALSSAVEATPEVQR